MYGKPRIGISACLLGSKVRYDGADKLDPYLAGTLVALFEYVPVCPEVEYGLGVPREPMRLMGGPDKPRLVTITTGIDHTGGMEEFARRRLGELESEGLCGFIFKARSPSCGMAGVEVFGQNGAASATGAGLFARAFMERFPMLPIAEEGGLAEPAIREEFIGRVFRILRARRRT